MPFRRRAKSVSLGPAPMPKKLTRAFSLIREVPTLGKVGYCLYRDSRVPVAPKVALAGALGLIVSPLDFPIWIPILGDLGFEVLANGQMRPVANV